MTHAPSTEKQHEMGGAEDISGKSQPEHLEKEAEDKSSTNKNAIDQLFIGGHTITPEALYAVADEHGYHEHRSGRLVLDPEEAKIEFGDAIAARLKLSDDQRFVLWPQPDDSPLDPQNVRRAVLMLTVITYTQWSNGRKSLMLAIISMAAFVPDFDSGLGIASLFALAAQYNTTTDEINNLTSNWSIFLLGPSGIFWIWLARRYGRLPVLFYSQLITLGFLIGATLAPNLSVFAGMRCLAAWFGNSAQTTGLYVIADLYPFHLQDTKVAIWTASFIISPFVSPFLGGFIVAKSTSWRWCYAFGCFYNAFVLGLIVLFMEETLYDRYVTPRPQRHATGLRYRVDTLLGVTGIKMQQLRPSLGKAAFDTLDVAWRPQTLMSAIYAGCFFGFGIGINVTQAVFIGSPPPLGYGYSQLVVAGSYATPIVAVVLGETGGAALLRWLVRRLTRMNHGVFESEQILWLAYVALPFFICGMVTLGFAFEQKFSYVAVVFGWGLAEISIFINTFTFYQYLGTCFPTRRGDVSALINFARTMFGFAVPYYIVTWSIENGASQSFGCEAAIVAGLFLLFVPFLQIKGSYVRNRFSIREAASGALTM